MNLKLLLKFLGRFIIGIFRKIVFIIFDKGKLPAHLYYSLFNSAFIREHRAVLAGRQAYAQALGAASESSVLLRRNIHRLEKGLIMRPRRAIFAEGYIGETVKAYQLLLKSAGTGDRSASHQDEIIWARDVLAEYFRVVDLSSPAIARAHELFCAVPDPEECQTRRRPYARDLSKPPPVSYEQLLELAKLRRSVRWFEQKPVPRELVDRAVKVAGYSPSACNRQPFYFRIFDDPEWIRSVGSIPMGTAGFSENFPGLIVVIGRLDAYFDERDRHVIYIDASLASMSLIYALETQGVSSCSINWPDVARLERRMARKLELKPFERVIMLIAYGYPDPEGLVPYSQKKPLDQLRRYQS